MMLDEADVEPSTELDVESHWDWEHLALFVLGLLFFFMFYRQIRFMQATVPASTTNSTLFS